MAYSRRSAGLFWRSVIAFRQMGVTWFAGGRVRDCDFPGKTPRTTGSGLLFLLIAAGLAAAGAVTAAAAAAATAVGPEGENHTDGHGGQQQPVKDAHYSSPAMV